MPIDWHISLLTPGAGGASTAAVVIAAVALVRRGTSFRRPSTLLMIAGAALLAAAAATPVWLRAALDRVTVMVDLSPSTRGADFRSRDRLNATVARLLGGTPVDWLTFADRNQPLPNGSTLIDLDCDHTVFAPPPGQPTLLFSDGQFELPAIAPPVFAVIDPQLIDPQDSAVASLDARGGVAVAAVRHTGPARPAVWDGTIPAASVAVTASTVLSMPIAGDGPVKLTLNPLDRWPENDALTAIPPPPEHAARWWIGDRDPGAGWLHLQPPQCPTSPMRWLDPSVVVIDDVAADALDRQQLDALQRYTRDLGGSVILLGGDHAFAAGRYGPTPLGAISPLADTPPVPAVRWIVLIDASGSMADPSPGGGRGSLFDAECVAARSLLPRLPPADAVHVGAFGRSVQWWIDSPAGVAAALPLPPPGAAASGPTLLESALRSVVQKSSTPTRLLLMTDADTDPVDADALASACAAANTRLLVLALGHGAALPSLTAVARRTGGSVVEQPDPARWTSAAQNLLRGALPDRLEHSAIDVTFARLGHRRVEPWNRTWLKQGADAIATAGDIPIVARWRVGSGIVTAAAYAMPPSDVDTLAHEIASSPSDPRFNVSWDTSAASPHVSVFAADADRPINRQALRLVCVDPQSDSTPVETSIPQTAPGRYGADLPPSGHARFFRVKLGGRTLDRRAVAGRYPREFDHIGVDRANLAALAARTGGAVIEPGDLRPLRPTFARSAFDFSPVLIGLGFVAIGLGLWQGRRSVAS